MRRHLRGVLFTALLLLFVILALLFSDFVSNIEPHTEDTARSERGAIVVLTGGRGRIAEGLRLLTLDAGQVLILSGVNSRASLKSIFPAGLPRGLEERIILEKKSTNTYENALEVEKILRKRGYDSMIFITSAYHMKRALFIFTSLISSDITIEPIGVLSPNYDEARPWAYKNLSINLSEFVKFWWFRVWFALSL